MLERIACLVLLLAGSAAAAEFKDLVAKFQSERGQPYQARIKTVREIASLGTEEAVEFLVRVIERDQDRSIQRNSIPQLARIPLPSAHSALCGLWRTVSKGDRGTLFHALAVSRKEELPAGILREVLAGSDQGLRSTAVQHLGLWKDPRFPREARRLLADFPTRGPFVLNTLRSHLTPEVVDLAVDLYDDSNSGDRGRIPAAFRAATTDVKTALLAHIEKAKDERAKKAVLIAGRAGIPSAEEAMTERLGGAKADLRVLLLEGISLLGARTPAGRNALLSHLQHRDESVRIAAVRAFRRTPVREAIPQLILLLEKAKGALAVEIQVTLERITGQQYGDRADLWRKWWEAYGGKFEPGEVKQRDAAVFDQALVNLAIDKGAVALRKMRGKAMPWTFRGHPVGTSALVLLALQAAGTPRKDRDMRAGIDYVLKQPLPNHTYSVALVAMCLEAIDARRFGRKIHEAGERLVETQRLTGSWSYPVGRTDNSNTQYAVLGLRAAARAGFEVPKRTWRSLRDHFLRTQNRDGGWGYPADGAAGSSTVSMTAGGVSSLLICGENLSLTENERAALDAAVEKGFAALGAKMSIGKERLYTLYGIERCGVLGRRALIGGEPWYAPGAARLVEEQGRDGSWVGHYDPAVDTAFAILFLKKFTAPIASPPAAKAPSPPPQGPGRPNPVPEKPAPAGEPGPGVGKEPKPGPEPAPKKPSVAEEAAAVTLLRQAESYGERRPEDRVGLRDRYLEVVKEAVPGTLARDEAASRAEALERELPSAYRILRLGRPKDLAPDQVRLLAHQLTTDLESGEQLVRLRAAEYLTRLRTGEAARELVIALGREKDPQTLEAVKAALRATPDLRVPKQLAGLRWSDRESVQRAALDVLDALARSTEEVAVESSKTIGTFVFSRIPVVAEEALSLLVGLGKVGAWGLMNAVTVPDRDLKLQVIDALGNTRVGEGAGFLAPFLVFGVKGDLHDFKVAAAAAIEKIGYPAVPHLAHFLDSPRHRQWTKGILYKITNRNFESKEALLAWLSQQSKGWRPK